MEITLSRTKKKTQLEIENLKNELIGINTADQNQVCIKN